MYARRGTETEQVQLLNLDDGAAADGETPGSGRETAVPRDGEHRAKGRKPRPGRVLTSGA